MPSGDLAATVVVHIGTFVTVLAAVNICAYTVVAELSLAFGLLAGGLLVAHHTQLVQTVSELVSPRPRSGSSTTSSSWHDIARGLTGDVSREISRVGGDGGAEGAAWMLLLGVAALIFVFLLSVCAKHTEDCGNTVLSAAGFLLEVLT